MRNLLCVLTLLTLLGADAPVSAQPYPHVDSLVSGDLTHYLAIDKAVYTFDESIRGRYWLVYTATQPDTLQLWQCGASPELQEAPCTIVPGGSPACDWQDVVSVGCRPGLQPIILVPGEVYAEEFVLTPPEHSEAMVDYYAGRTTAREHYRFTAGGPEWIVVPYTRLAQTSVLLNTWSHIKQLYEPQKK